MARAIFNRLPIAAAISAFGVAGLAAGDFALAAPQTGQSPTAAAARRAEADTIQLAPEA